MSKFFAFSKWTLTGKVFMHTVGAMYDSAEEAEMEAKKKADMYGDQEFVTVLEADSYITAKEKAVKLGIMK